MVGLSYTQLNYFSNTIKLDRISTNKFWLYPKHKVLVTFKLFVVVRDRLG